MSSLPYFILSCQNEEILSSLTVQEHQKFCKLLLKSYQSYEKRKSEEKADKNKFKSEEEFLQTQRKQNQEDIMKWFENLSEYQRISICTIKNKWLINILIQLYLLYKTYDSCFLKPILDMENLFQPQKNFSHDGEDVQFQSLDDLISQKNLKNYNHRYFPNDLNFYENYFSIIYPNNHYI